MTQPKPRSLPSFDPRATHPRDYQQGVDIANRIINRPIRMNRTLFIDHAIELVTQHMTAWPQAQRNGLTDRQWARSAGFAHTLIEYRRGQGS
jgi:hypothetical protein